jgi:hypothetical protein
VGIKVEDVETAGGLLAHQLGKVPALRRVLGVGPSAQDAGQAWICWFQHDGALRASIEHLSCGHPSNRDCWSRESLAAGHARTPVPLCPSQNTSVDQRKVAHIARLAVDCAAVRAYHALYLATLVGAGPVRGRVEYAAAERRGGTA